MSFLPKTEETANFPTDTVHINYHRAGARGQILAYAEPLFPLILLSLSSLIIYLRWRQQVVIGPGWDPFAFLANALEFAGKGIGYSEPHRPPFLPFLTSLLFRAGFVSESALFLVDGALLLIGIMGLYFLLKLRFPNWLSFSGALLFLSFPAVLNIATTGYTDLPSVAISIWAIYSLILALEKDKRFHWVAWPLLTLASLTRFTGFLLLIPILPLVIGRASIVRNLKDIALGSLLSFIIILPTLFFYGKKFGDPIFPFTHAFFSATEAPPYLESFAYKPDLLWFFKKLETFTLSSPFPLLFPLLVSLVGIGMVLRLVSLIRQSKKDALRYLFILTALLFYLFIFVKFGFAVRQAFLVIIGILLYLHFQKVDSKVGLDILFLLWFLTYFDFHSHDPLKVERYFVVMAPGITYATLLGFENLANSFNRNFLRISLNASILLMLGVIAFTSFTNSLQGKKEKDPLVADAIKTSKWLQQNDPKLAKAKIYSDLWPVFSWYLRQKVDPMPFFKDRRAFNHELVKKNIDYYLTIRNRELPAYDIKAQIGNVTVFKRGNKQVQNLQRVLYLGMNWEHYLEDVLNFRYFVISEPGKYYLGKSLYIDSYSLKELKKYPLIVLYNFKWHNRKRAESLLKNYTSSGRSIIIDASGNNGSMAYNLEGDIFLGVSIARKPFPSRPVINIDPALSISNINFSPFRSDNETWYGMTYYNLDKRIPFKILATANGDTLIAEQKIGQGKIIWIGFNLVWHSFYTKNREEQKLIQKLVEYALRKASKH